MASKHFILPIRHQTLQSISNASHQPTRSMATHVSASASASTAHPPRPKPLIAPHPLPPHLAQPDVLTTLYAFPSLEPLQFLRYPPTHLNVPLRKDILHKAVIFEGDATRQGTASTKYRSEVHGSNRKIRPQKGTGRARLGNKKSPMLRGGGVAFGPHPRDFSTGLNQKVYDLAVRTALSYRYRKGELLIVDGLDIPENITSTDEAFWLKACFDTLRWGNGNGNSLVVSEADEEENRLVRVLNQNRNFGRGRGVGTVDVKNLLGMGRVVIERGALDALLGNHQSDLRWPVRKREAGVEGMTRAAGVGVVQEMVDEMEEEELREEDVIDASISDGIDGEISTRLEK